MKVAAVAGTSPDLRVRSHSALTWRQLGYMAATSMAASLFIFLFRPGGSGRYTYRPASSCRVHANTIGRCWQWRIHLQTCQSQPGLGFKHRMEFAEDGGSGRVFHRAASPSIRTS